MGTPGAGRAKAGGRRGRLPALRVSEGEAQPGVSPDSKPTLPEVPSPVREVGTGPGVQPLERGRPRQAAGQRRVSLGSLPSALVAPGAAAASTSGTDVSLCEFILTVHCLGRKITVKKKKYEHL